jgi:hypothetical protein
MADLDVSAARDSSADVVLPPRVVVSSDLAPAIVCACAWGCGAARASSSAHSAFRGGDGNAKLTWENAPALRCAKIKDASVGACARSNEQESYYKKHARTSGQSTVRAFMFITYNQLEKASLNVSRDALNARSPSTLPRNASASSASSASAGSRNPKPCGASW